MFKGQEMGSSSLSASLGTHCIQDVNLQPEIIKFQRKKIEEMLQDTGRGIDLLDKTQEAKTMNKKLNKWNCIMLSSVCTAKEATKKVETTDRMAENIPKLCF